MSAVENGELVRIAEIEGRGRALVASHSLGAGQLVLRDSPILLYSALPLINDNNKNSSNNCYCSYCFRTLQPTSAVSCPSCSPHHALFCNPNCLSLALSSSHSPWVCQALCRLRDSPSLSIQHQDRQAQARFLLAAYNLALVSPSHFQILLSLQGEESPPEAQFLHTLIVSLCPPPPPQGIPGFSVQLTAALLAKDKLNAFALMEPFTKDGHRSVRAYGIYPNASLFNHDCLPNACRFDYVDTASDRNTDIIVRLIHDVPQGREICLSYFPVNQNYSNRQRRLLEDYGFACECDRCKVEANWSDNDEDDDEEVMDEDHDEQMAASVSDTENAAQEGDNDFPHAYFFLRYMCNRENCWGTLAPLPPSDASPSYVMECNVCGNLKKDDEIDGDGGEDGLPMDE